jgi:transcriptional regulator with XRE-family HTH domain
VFRFHPEQVGERLHALRRRRGQTLRELGAQAEVNYVTLSKIERGKMPQVSADIVARVAVALAVSTDYLLGLADDPQASVAAAPQATPSAARPREDAHDEKPTRQGRRGRQAAPVA